MFRRKTAPAPDPLVVRVDRQIANMVDALEARQQYLRTVLRRDLEELHEVEARLAHISCYSPPIEDPLIEDLADALQDSLTGLENLNPSDPLPDEQPDPESSNSSFDRWPQTYPKDTSASGV